MDRKQKEQLRILLKARKRADKVLAKRREAERQKQDHDQQVKTNQELMAQYTEELNALAQESGILALSEQAAQRKGGRLTQELSCYVYYGISGSSFQNALGVAQHGQLRAAHLALKIAWKEADSAKAIEVRVHKNGVITFQSIPIPVLPFLWRRYPQVLEKLMDMALNRPGGKV